MHLLLLEVTIHEYYTQNSVIHLLSVFSKTSYVATWKKQKIKLESLPPLKVYFRWCKVLNVKYKIINVIEHTQVNFKYDSEIGKVFLS